MRFCSKLKNRCKSHFDKTKSDLSLRCRASSFKELPFQKKCLGDKAFFLQKSMKKNQLKKMALSIIITYFEYG